MGAYRFDQSVLQWGIAAVARPRDHKIRGRVAIPLERVAGTPIRVRGGVRDAIAAVSPEALAAYDRMDRR